MLHSRRTLGLRRSVAVAALGVALAVALLIRLVDEGADHPAVKRQASAPDGPSETETVVPAPSPATLASIGTPPATAPTPTLDERVCGAAAFGHQLDTSHPIFSRPDGYRSGWIAAGASEVVIDGGSYVIDRSYVLVVDDLAHVQLFRVARQERNGPARVDGCWYRAEVASQALLDARVELERLRRENPHPPPVLISASGEGLREIDP